MFDTCVQAILIEVNRYITTRTDTNEDRVIYLNYKNLQTNQSDTLISNKNNIIMSLVDIVHEDIYHNTTTYIQQGNNYIIRNLPINFYMYVLFAVHYKDQDALEGLKYLSKVIAFFQSKNHFTNKNTPELQATDLEEFSVELIKLDYQQKSALWNCLNSTYMPSVLYKIGMIPIADTPEKWLEIPQIAKINKIT